MTGKQEGIYRNRAAHISAAGHKSRANNKFRFEDTLRRLCAKLGSINSLRAPLRAAVCLPLRTVTATLMTNNKLFNKRAHFRRNRTWHFSSKHHERMIWLTRRPFPSRPALHFRLGVPWFGIPWRGTGRRAAERGCPSVFSSMGAFHRSARLSAPPRSQQHCADSSMNITQLRVTRLVCEGAAVVPGLSLTQSGLSLLHHSVTPCVKKRKEKKKSSYRVLLS